MGRKRLIVEFGMGADLHGENVTKAAQKAVKDAISRSCLYCWDTRRTGNAMCRDSGRTGRGR